MCSLGLVSESEGLSMLLQMNEIQTEPVLLLAQGKEECSLATIR